MRFDTLACDYDGTLAANGVVTPQTLLALQRWKNKGGKLLLVTGRELEDIRSIFNHISLFERIIAENGAVLFNPASGTLRMLVKPAPQNLIDCDGGTLTLYLLDIPFWPPASPIKPLCSKPFLNSGSNTTSSSIKVL